MTLSVVQKSCRPTGIFARKRRHIYLTIVNGMLPPIQLTTPIMHVHVEIMYINRIHIDDFMGSLLHDKRIVESLNDFTDIKLTQ